MSPRIEDIPLEEFDLSLAGMRIMNPDLVSRVQDSMWLHGQLQPVVAREHEGKYQILDGFKRVYVAMDLMINTLQCQVLDIDLQQAKLLILSYNRPHQSMEVWEEAMVLEDLLKTHDLSQQSLSTLTGYRKKSKRLDFRLELQVVKEAHLLFKVIDQRYNDNKSLIFTTNVEEPDWAEFLGDPITTSAILDRIFHHSVIVRINGPSYRMYQSELLQKEYAEKKQEKTETG